MPNETLKTIRSLRTTHWDFSEKPVSREDIETIIAPSTRAANSDNLTDYSVIVVDDPATLNVISGGESGGKAFTCLIYAIDHARIIRCARELGYDKFHPLDRLYNLFIAMYDVCAAAQIAVVAAKSMGIDALVTNFIHRNKPDETAALLNLPKEYCFPVIQVVLGYSDKPTSDKPRRLSAKHIIHYGKYRPVEEIDAKAIIAEMDAIYPERISDTCRHAMDWYFSEWFRDDWFDEATYQRLSDALTHSKLLVEPTLR